MIRGNKNPHVHPVMRMRLVYDFLRGARGAVHENYTCWQIGAVNSKNVHCLNKSTDQRYLKSR